jgi:hypothetical protein
LLHGPAVLDDHADGDGGSLLDRPIGIEAASLSAVMTAITVTVGSGLGHQVRPPASGVLHGRSFQIM